MAGCPVSCELLCSYSLHKYLSSLDSGYGSVSGNGRKIVVASGSHACRPCRTCGVSSRRDVRSRHICAGQLYFYRAGAAWVSRVLIDRRHSCAEIYVTLCQQSTHRGHSKYMGRSSSNMRLGKDKKWSPWAVNARMVAEKAEQ